MRVCIYSGFKPKKFAGEPPYKVIMSIVAIAKPAPLTVAC